MPILISRTILKFGWTVAVLLSYSLNVIEFFYEKVDPVIGTLKGKTEIHEFFESVDSVSNETILFSEDSF